MILLNALQGIAFGIIIAFVITMIIGPVYMTGRFLFRRTVAILFNKPRFESGNGAPKSWWD